MSNEYKVALIDSGIDYRNAFVNSNVIGGISFFIENDRIIENSQYFDQHGHGTWCGTVIKQAYPNVKLYIVKVLDERNKGDCRCLIRALEHLVCVPVDLICMSLATQSMTMIDELQSACCRLVDQGKLLLSALDNRARYSLPASLPFVIGVQGSNFNDSDVFWYNSKYDIQCVADGCPILVKTIDGAYTFFGGNSKAVAHVSGTLLKIFDEKEVNGYWEVKERLESGAARRKWKQEDIGRNFQFPVEFGSHGSTELKRRDYDVLSSIVEEELQIPSKTSYTEPLLISKNLRSPSEYGKVMQRIEEYWGLDFSNMRIPISVFSTIDVLGRFVLEQLIS